MVFLQTREPALIWRVGGLPSAQRSAVNSQMYDEKREDDKVVKEKVQYVCVCGVWGGSVSSMNRISVAERLTRGQQVCFSKGVFYLHFPYFRPFHLSLV